MPEETPHAETAAQVRRLRAERGMTLRAVAALLGVTERTVARWEAGEGAPRSGDLALLEAEPVVPCPRCEGPGKGAP